MTRSPVSIMAVVLAVGCGGRASGASAGTSGGEGSGSRASSGTTAGLDASMAMDGPGAVTGRNPQCPAAVPTGGGPCTAVPLECEYGDDSHHVCTTLAVCLGIIASTPYSAWSVSPPALGCSTNPASCPSSFTALATGAACPVGAFVCQYPEGLCQCLPCNDEAGISRMWSCNPWGPAGTGCPAERPLIGDACSVPNQYCSYGGHCGAGIDPDMVCQFGYWQQASDNGVCLPQCSVPEMDASDGVVADASCDVGGPSTVTSCPSLAPVCPCGCRAAAQPQLYDRARGCLEPPSAEVNVCTSDGVSQAVLGCWARVDTGGLYFFAGLPFAALAEMGSVWRQCTPAEQSLVFQDGGTLAPQCPP